MCKKMKCISVLAVILISVVTFFMLRYYNTTIPKPSPERILRLTITGAGGFNSCFLSTDYMFELSSDDLLTVISSNHICFEDIQSENKAEIVDDVKEEAMLALAHEEMEIIDKLIQNMTIEGSNIYDVSDFWVLHDGIEVTALVNGQIYYSLYSFIGVGDEFNQEMEILDDPKLKEMIHRTLLRLTYHLVKLSPITVGGTDAPLPIFD